MSLYGRSHYEDFAKVVARWEMGEPDEPDTYKTMKDLIVELFTKDNPSFKPERFLAKIDEHVRSILERRKSHETP